MIRVLFMQTQTFLGADSRLHTVLMEHLDRNEFEVHVALNRADGEGSPNPADVIDSLEDVDVRRTWFGTSVHGRSRRQVALDTLTRGLPTAIDQIRLIRYARSNRIDVVHSTEKPRDVLFGLLVAKASSAKLVVHLHVNVEDWISRWVRLALHRADALVGVSRFTAASAVDYGYRADRVHAVLNGLDIRHWDPDTSGRGIRREFEIADETPLIVIASRLFHWKGHRQLIEALAITKQTHPDFHLLVVGEDDPRSAPDRGPFSEELQELVADLDLQTHVTFTGFRSDMQEVMAAADIFAHPSPAEPFGMVYVEAMAMRTPVVTVSTGGSGEVVEHETSGLLSDPQDIEAMARNITRLLDDPDLRERLGENGRQCAVEYFNPDRMARDMEAVYRSVVGQPLREVPSRS